MTFVNFLLFVLASMGFTNIVVHSYILEGFREWIRQDCPLASPWSIACKTWDWIFHGGVINALKDIITCYQCAGFWCGLIIGYILISHHILGILACGFAGSYLAETSEIIKEYFVANSLVKITTNEE